MCAKLTDISGLPLDYDADVLPLSRHAEGGSVTERHLLCALSLAAIREYGGAARTPNPSAKPGDALFDFFRDRLSFGAGDIDKLKASWEASTSGASRAETLATSCPYGDGFFLYDLIGVLKASLVERFYIPAGPAECPPTRDLIAFARAHHIIITYPYLGDVTDSVTGDKKAQKFEDDYLDELIGILYGVGVRAISYMPARNSRAQVARVRALADRYGMLQISGEDINSPRQPFISEASKDPYFANLRETTWRLVAHERGEATLP
jgi:hypothetical protein